MAATCHCNERKSAVSQDRAVHNYKNISVLKQGSRTHSATSAQFTIAKIRGCANVSLISSRSEGMQQGWRTPRLDSLKLVNYTRIENAHKVRKNIFMWLLYVQ